MSIPLTTWKYIERNICFFCEPTHKYYGKFSKLYFETKPNDDGPIMDRQYFLTVSIDSSKIKSTIKQSFSLDLNNIFTYIYIDINKEFPTSESAQFKNAIYHPQLTLDGKLFKSVFVAHHDTTKLSLDTTKINELKHVYFTMKDGIIQFENYHGNVFTRKM